MNISTSIEKDGDTRYVTVRSNIELHEDVVWSVAGQALAAEEGLELSQLSRSYEAYDIRAFANKHLRTPYIAKFVKL